MNFYQLAFRYLKRKKGKVVLLLLILLFVSSMILCTNMILHATGDSKAELQAKTKAKIIVETTDINKKITEKEAEKISSLDNVISLNRVGHNMALPADVNVVTQSDSADEANRSVSVYSYDDLGEDSIFQDGQYKIISGSSIKPGSSKSVVINSVFARQNNLKTGGTLTLKSGSGVEVTAEITGIFLAGNEEKQGEDTNSGNRIENQIYTDNETYSELFKNDGYYKISVYCKNPEALSGLKNELTELLPDYVELTTSDTLYRQMEAPLEQIERITQVMLVMTFITGTVVVSLILCMWARTRKKEMAVFISLGKTKPAILLQVLLEASVVFFLAVIGACALGQVMAGFIESMLTLSASTDIALCVRLQPSDVLALAGLGGVTVIIGVFCSALPILRANPKETLSRMEG